MITRLFSWHRSLRRLFSRREWLRLLFWISKAEKRNAAGLIILKISPFSHKKFHELLAAEKLPFVKFLLEREHYQLYHFENTDPEDVPPFCQPDSSNPVPTIGTGKLLLIYLFFPFHLLRIFRVFLNFRHFAFEVRQNKLYFFRSVVRNWKLMIEQERVLQTALFALTAGETCIPVNLKIPDVAERQEQVSLQLLRYFDYAAKSAWRTAARLGRRDYVLWGMSAVPHPTAQADVQKSGFLLCPRHSFHQHINLQQALSTEFVWNAANRLLQILPPELPRPTKTLIERPEKVRIMTYNTHICHGMDGVVSPRRIARVIAEHRPDVVCLQELDVNNPRTGSENQPQIIAEELGMEVVFHPACENDGQQYGIAILSHLPMKVVKKVMLPGVDQDPNIEPRGAIWVQVDVHGAVFQLITTHLGLRGWEKKLQVEALLGEQFLSSPDIETPIMLCGDFNLTPRSFLYALITDVLQDSQSVLNLARSTWFTHWPMLRLDHVFASDDLSILDVKIPDNVLAKVASDHLPLIADVQFWKAET